ncbi:hypothetical protein HNP84_002609 [Thermocatellispora tengchongensis]|uniref:Uncharacterized protein n=1 Tax=Thermocatellispora tengchongensis TaxID=1073253 RepID=A0A840NZH2_9ACTN|nr:hypothetical protein [Thermocatellispora tengchongensis]MBB5132888.1 hypothetical protein [Thermocatellispora tengchongensis]
MSRYPHLDRAAAGRPFGEVEVVFAPAKPTTRRGLTRVVLRPGVIDDNADEFFAWGYCWLLAAALREATGWPFGLVERRRADAWEWTHVGVITPGGSFLDIRGYHDRTALAADLEAAYGLPTRIRVGTFADLCQAMRIPKDTQPDWWLSMLSEPVLADVVRYFAAHLLDQRPRTEVA